MNLQRIQPQWQPDRGTQHPRLMCRGCGGSFFLNDGYADLNGEPFRAFYCEDCAQASEQAMPDSEYRASSSR